MNEKNRDPVIDITELQNQYRTFQFLNQLVVFEWGRIDHMKKVKVVHGALNKNYRENDIQRSFKMIYVYTRMFRGYIFKKDCQHF